MSYKANKNLTAPVFALLLILGNAHLSYAQGVVSLVEEDNSGVDDDAFPNVDTGAEPAPVAAPNDESSLDTDVPNTLSEADVIPLDSGLISPQENEPVAPQAAPEETQAQDDPFAAMDAEVAAEAAPKSAEPSDGTSADDFSLGLEAVGPQGQPVEGDAAQKADSENKAEDNSALFPGKEKAAEPEKPAEKFANSVLAKIDNDLFGQMSDIEKQTTLLTLELRREKIRSEIEAVKAQREKAEQEKIAAEEEKKRKEEELKKEQEAKVLREQQALQDKMIELEKLKQRKMLNSYMNQMLEINQNWIEKNAALHAKLKQAEEDRQSLIKEYKAKIADVTKKAADVLQNATTAKNNHDRTVASLTAQNIQLKKRIEADALAAKNREENPFGDQQGKDGVSTGVDGQIAPQVLAKEYAIMEITGKGEDLLARLINKNGETFVVRKGTTLNTGHVVKQISEKYIKFDKNGLEDYLYTAGSSLGGEPQKMEGTDSATAMPAHAPAKPTVTMVQPKPRSGTDEGIPSLGTGMFVK